MLSSAAHPAPKLPNPTDHPRIAITILFACAGVFVAYLPVVGVPVALSVLQRGLDASYTDLQWITDAFILPTAVLLLTCGVLGELYGRKKICLAGLAVFSVGYLTCLTASSAVQVCVGQAIAGVGTAAVLPTTLALLSHVCPDHRRRAGAIALWTASLALGLTVGPLLSGVIAEHASWRWIFLPGLVAGVIVLIAGALAVPESRSTRAQYLDIPGQVLAILALTGLIVGVIEGGETGWAKSLTMLAFAVAAAASAGFIVAELRSLHPMLDMRLFRSPAFSGAAIVMTFTLFAQVGLVFALSLYFGLVQHSSTLAIAVILTAINGCTVVLGPLLGRLMNRTGPGLVLTSGLFLGGCGALCTLALHPDTRTGTAAAVITVFGVGIALAIAPITTIAVNSVPGHLAGIAGAANSALRQIGGALGPAIFGVILSTGTLSALPLHLAGAGVDSTQQNQLISVVSRSGIQAGAFVHIGSDATTEAVRTAYGMSVTTGLHTCALVGGIGMLAATLVALLLVGVRNSGFRAAETDAEPAETSHPAAS